MRIKGLLLGLLVFALGGCGSDVDGPSEQQVQAADETVLIETEGSDQFAAETTPAANESTAGTIATSTPQRPAATENIVLAQADPTPRPESRFQLGKEYQRLTPTQPTSSSPEQVEVAEVFWYGCSHCYSFDPYVEKWLTRKPDNVNFVRIPAVWNPLVKFHARAFYTAQALDKEDAMHTAFFREIHLNGNVLDSEAKLKEFFGRFGVSDEDFSGAFNSFAVHTKLQQAETLARRYRVTSVPLVVVNGKYTTSATMTGGYETLIEVIDELVVLEGNAT